VHERYRRQTDDRRQTDRRTDDNIIANVNAKKTADVIVLCLYDRLQDAENLLNAHVHPLSCVYVRPLPQAQCDDNQTPSPPTGPPPITIRSYITAGTFRCDSARFLNVFFFNKISVLWTALFCVLSSTFVYNLLKWGRTHQKPLRIPRDFVELLLSAGVVWNSAGELHIH